jgi:UDP-N-acetylglucosamine diphosphorylase/glucosamine-1-phosphate N-acetyltransferase
MDIVLFEDEAIRHLFPLCYTRPAGALRHGIFTNDERWSRVMDVSCHHHTRPYLQALFLPHAHKALCINARLLPSPALVDQLKSLDEHERLVSGDQCLAFIGKPGEAVNQRTPVESSETPVLINRIADLFLRNGETLAYDFGVLTAGRTSQHLHKSNRVIGDPARLFLEEGSRVWDSTFNVTEGPVYIGPHAEVMEGSRIRGGFSLGAYAQVRMGTRIYGPTTIGPGCKVGGEISNSVFTGFSNKAHDGFVGNSVIGEWCNLGADTNTSNLKNNYSHVKVHNYMAGRPEDTGLVFHGLTMADYSRCGINTMFNTGTVVGVSCSVAGAGFMPTHIPSFTWQAGAGTETYDLGRAIETAGRVMKRRGLGFTPERVALFEALFQLTTAERG